MQKTRWPDDHPNGMILMFVESSRLVLERAGRGPIVDSTAMLLDRIEALIDEMTVGRTVAELQQLIAEVAPLANQALAQMQAVRAQLDAKT